MNPKEMKIKKKAKEERLRYRSIIITPGLVGFKAQVGCSEAYFGGATQLLGALSKYLNDPQGTEREYLRNDQRECGLGYLPAPNVNLDRRSRP